MKMGKKLGAIAINVLAIGYAIYRLNLLFVEFTWINTLVALCELSLLALVSVEATLMATKTSKKPRKQDDTFLIESAKTILFSTNSKAVGFEKGGADTKVETTQIAKVDSYATPHNVDVVVFAQECTLEQIRRCFLSVNLLEDINRVFVIDPTLSPERENLTKEFGFHPVEKFHNIISTTDKVLICRGTDILYPDAIKVARTYETDGSTFLELRSVYSDERALGVNGVVDVTDKRQMIRESLSTRGLATWSTGPAIVDAQALQFSSHSRTSTEFFRSCEKNGIHGVITDEIVSEEISHEQTISEVEWRSLDFAYASGAWKNSYKQPGSKMIGLGIKTWSAMINTSLVRRIITIALVLFCVVKPTSFTFVDINYIAIGFVVTTLIFALGMLLGDKRSPLARIREFYFDIEAVMYTVYKTFIKPEDRAKDTSIVKKLPSVSTLLILTDVVLVTRVFQQYNNELKGNLDHFLKNISLFSGYTLLVTLLVGLGMVIVKQSRSAMRREVSRGANINSEPIAMIDLSPGGAGCVSVTPLEIGAEVEFESSLPTKADNIKFSCKAIVRSNVAWNDSYRVGLEFTDLNQEQVDVLETYCSVIYPHSQAREVIDKERAKGLKTSKLNGKAEKRFLSYAASFIALGAVIFLNLSSWQ